MTQAQLAEALGTNASVVSLLESGSRGLSDKWLRRLAPVLRVSAGFILDHDPHDLPTEVLDIWADIPDESREQALQILSTFRKPNAA